MENKMEQWFKNSMNNFVEAFGERMESITCDLSPIEKKFYIAWNIEMLGRYDEISLYFYDDDKYPLLIPQKEIIIKEKHYRVDFLLIMKDLKNWEKPVIKKDMLIIELDSYLWHGADPMQFTKEKERERELQKEGYKIIRFSGREVYRDVEECIDEIIGISAKM